MLSAKLEHFQAHLASYALEEGLQRISVVKIVRMCWRQDSAAVPWEPNTAIQ